MGGCCLGRNKPQWSLDPTSKRSSPFPQPSATAVAQSLRAVASGTLSRSNINITKWLKELGNWGGAPVRAALPCWRRMFGTSRCPIETSHGDCA